MKLRNKYKLKKPVHIKSGDRLKCTVDCEEVFNEAVKQNMTVDTVATFNIQNEFGFVSGICSILGKERIGE